MSDVNGFPNSPLDPVKWNKRIANALRAGGARGVATLIKPAAIAAAASGRLDLVRTWLEQVPADWVRRDPQLLYWSGATVVLQRPADAHMRFVRAFEIFSHRCDDEWTWLAWAGVVDSIFLLYRDLSELDAWIAWITPEREVLLDRMKRQPRGLIIASTFFALCFRYPTHPQVAVWRERAERYIELDPVSDIGARMCVALVIDYIWRGDMNGATTAWKRFHARADSKTLSPLATVLGHLNDSTYYLHFGELDKCLQSVREGLEASAQHAVLVWAGVFHCHAVSVACSREDVKLARAYLTQVETLLGREQPIDEAYYRGVSAWTAHIAGNQSGMVSMCEASVTYGDRKGVPYLSGVSKISAALPLFTCGHRARAWRLLEDGEQTGAAIGNQLLVWIAALFRAHFHYEAGDHALGDQALATAMRLGHDHAFKHFFCWPRRVVAKLLDRAFTLGFFPDYAHTLAALHGLAPGPTPTSSDAWPFVVRVYTLGEPRIVFANGQSQPLSVQFSRQLELLTTLIVEEGAGVPMYRIGSSIYQRRSSVDTLGSTKSVLRSLRARIGPVVRQRHGLVELDFTKVWIDACSFMHLRRHAAPAEIAQWLDRHYHGHFLEPVEDSEIVLDARRRIGKQVEKVLRTIVARRREERPADADRRFEARWQRLFPEMFR